MGVLGDSAAPNGYQTGVEGGGEEGARQGDQGPYPLVREVSSSYSYITGSVFSLYVAGDMFSLTVLND